MRLIAGLMAVALALAACGNTGQGPLANAVQNVLTPAAPRLSMDAQRAQVLAAVAESGSTEPVLLVEIPQLQAVASLVIAGRNGDVITWMDPSGVSIATENGVLRSTRGLGFDLMASDVAGTLAALQGRSLGYDKVLRHLNGEGVLENSTFTCTLRNSAGRVSETCAGAQGAIETVFTLEGQRVVAGRQWVSPQIGYIETKRLQ